MSSAGFWNSINILGNLIVDYAQWRSRLCDKEGFFWLILEEKA